MNFKSFAYLAFVILFVSFGVQNCDGQRSRSRLSPAGVTPSPSETSSSHATDGPLSRLRRPTRRTTTPISVRSTTTTTPQGQSSSSPNSRTSSPNQPINKSQQQRQNNDSVRKEMIEKLCSRKHGAAATLPSVNPPVSTRSPTTTTPKPASITTTTATFTNDNFSEPQRTLPRNPLRRSQAHVRVPRRVKKLYRSTTTTTTTTPGTGDDEGSNFPPFPSPTSSTSSLPLGQGGATTSKTTTNIRTGGDTNAQTCTDFDHLNDEQLAKRVKGGLRRKNKPE
ncbi:mucin-2 [Folsomia candida]|uniref:Uncharacterized protein n=1 Tax=Folsomia candida TaxID=158441 RepID=A0A226EGA2_FOLCA|nr:mucin-2 [Folsomia candida]OXA56592.1 hypothetical protein Fcan01_09468 [Folsomia candida]